MVCYAHSLTSKHSFLIKRLIYVKFRYLHFVTRLYYADIDIDRLAKGTIGCTGADLENIVNQAALKAAIDNCDEVSMSHLEYAKDKVLMGKIIMLSKWCFFFILLVQSEL